MLKFRIAWVAAIWAVLSGCTAWGEEPAADAKKLVTAEVLTPTGNFVPGKAFTLAVRLKIAPEWHVYWLNPGDSGMATAVALKLPAGWTKTDWAYPIPEAIDQAGLVAYGYQDEVVLVTTVTPSLEAKEPVVIGVDVVYLVCKARCLPGKHHLDLKLTPAVEEGPASPAFEGVWKVWQPRLPISPVADLAVAKVKVTELKDWTPLEYSYSCPDMAKSVEVFPLPSGNLELRNIAAVPDKNGAVIKMEGKLYSGQTDVPDKVRALLVFTTEAGEKRAHWVDLPVSETKP